MPSRSLCVRVCTVCLAAVLTYCPCVVARTRALLWLRTFAAALAVYLVVRHEPAAAVRLPPRLPTSQALEAQPNSHVIFSNRSAAYLKKGDLAEALADAEACVRVAPTWVKGYSRLASALVAMDRYTDCIDTCKKGSVT